MISTFGYCNSCNSTHSLEEGNAREYCYKLMQLFDTKKTIDVWNDAPDPHFSTDYLFGDARGQMFGALECLDTTGKTVVLYAFSCQYNGIWNICGWCPPLLDLDAYNRIVPPVDRQIKALGKKIEILSRDSPERKALISERKQISQVQMKRIHDLYSVVNFRGENLSLSEIYSKGRGIPTGTGDCCAPKLLNYAALNGLKPLGLAEFYWGKENRSLTKKHGEFYACCANKCQPILGYMLCGADK